MAETWILYRTENSVNGKSYVGVHKLINTWKSKSYLGSGKALKIAIEKYGRANFIRATLAEFSSAEEAYLAETNMVNEEFIKRPDTYNMKIGGMGCKGLTLTEAHKAIISAANKGKILTTETKNKIRNANTGKKLSEELKLKLSKAHTGKLLTEETKAKISTANKGKIVSKETKTKISIANKGKVRSEETKRKISMVKKGIATTLGMKHTPEARANMSAAQKGRKHTNEAKAKIIAANIKPVVIDGKYYPSAKVASEIEKVPYPTLTGRIRKSSPKWSEWRFATEEEKLQYNACAL